MKISLAHAGETQQQNAPSAAASGGRGNEGSLASILWHGISGSVVENTAFFSNHLVLYSFHMGRPVSVFVYVLIFLNSSPWEFMRLDGVGGGGQNCASAVREAKAAVKDWTLIIIK